MLVPKALQSSEVSTGKFQKDFAVCLEFISYSRQEGGDVGCFLSEDYLLCSTDLRNTTRDKNREIQRNADSIPSSMHFIPNGRKQCSHHMLSWFTPHAQSITRQCQARTYILQHGTHQHFHSNSLSKCLDLTEMLKLYFFSFKMQFEYQNSFTHLKCLLMFCLNWSFQTWSWLLIFSLL